MTYRYTIIAIISVWILLVSCNENEKDDIVPNDKQIIENYLTANPQIEAQYLSNLGIFKQGLITNEAGQPIQEGSIVNVYYTIKGLERVVIDQNTQTGNAPAKMQVGTAAIYPIGFDMALATMRTGEKARFFIPSHLAYKGISVAGLIENNVVLDVEIEVVSQLSLDQQLVIELTAIQNFIDNYRYNDSNPSRVFFNFDGNGRVRITDPAPDSLVAVGSKVSLAFTTRLINGSAVANSSSANFEFIFGNQEVIPGLERGIGLMNFGESAIILFPSQLGYGASVKVMPDLIKTELVEKDVIPEYSSRIGPFQPLLFEVDLL